MQWIRRVARLVGTVLAVLVVFGLLPVGSATPTAAAADERPARVRVVHAIPDAPNVDVFVNGNRALTNVPFFTVSDYLTLPAGSYRVQVVPTGVRPTHRASLIEGRLSFEPGTDYSVVARGTAARNDREPIGASLLRDNNLPPVLGEARLRVAHFSPDAPNVDIFVNGERTVTNLRYRTASAYLGIPAGEYTFGVAPAGGQPIFTTTATIEAGQVVTAWANGLLNGSGAQAFKVTPTIDRTYSATARLRAVHAVPDLAGSPVDVFLNNAKVATFDFFTATEYLTVYAGRYDVRVVPAGGNPATDAATRHFVTLEEGKDYSVVARGTVAQNDQAQLGLDLRTDDNTAPAAGQVRLRVAHYSPDAPNVDIFVNGERTVTNLRYRTLSAYLSVPAGEYTFGVAPTGGQPIFTTTATVEPGQVVTAWANGLLGGAGAQAFKVTPTIDRAGEGATPEPENARLRVLHASPDAPNVDIFVHGERAVTDLAFGSITPYLPLAAGSYTVEVRVANTSTVVFTAPVTLEGGKIYTAAALGVVGNVPGAAPFTVSVFEDER
jgi:hypothetical protein